MTAKEKEIELATKLQRPLVANYPTALKIAHEVIKLGYRPAKPHTLISDEEIASKAGWSSLKKCKESALFENIKKVVQAQLDKDNKEHDER